jgi:hypothetical protein
MCASWPVVSGLIRFNLLVSIQIDSSESRSCSQASSQVWATSLRQTLWAMALTMAAASPFKRLRIIWTTWVWATALRTMVPA